MPIDFGELLDEKGRIMKGTLVCRRMRNRQWAVRVLDDFGYFMSSPDPKKFRISYQTPIHPQRGRRKPGYANAFMFCKWPDRVLPKAEFGQLLAAERRRAERRRSLLVRGVFYYLHQERLVGFENGEVAVRMRKYLDWNIRRMRHLRDQARKIHPSESDRIPPFAAVVRFMKELGYSLS